MRGFLIKSRRSNGYYCSKCGKLLPNDRYSMEKHSTICWKRPLEEADILKEFSDQVYTIEDQYKKIILTVRIPYVDYLSDDDDSIAAVKWDTGHKFYFYCGENANRRLSKARKDELDNLLSLIQSGYITSGMEESAAEIIHRTFPGVLAVYDLTMFTNICINKGFHYRKALPEKEEKALLKLRPGDLSPKTETKDRKENLFSLQAKVYRYRKETYTLRVVAEREGERTVFLFSRGYAACSDLSRVESFLEGGCRMTEDSRKAVALFDKIFPEFLLGQYMKYSDNILVPLIAPDYHKGMELAAKSGAAVVAENFRSLQVFNRDPSTYTNLKDMFGLPARVLRGLCRECVTNKNIEKLSEIFKYNPAFLNFDTITPSMMEYLNSVDLTNAGARGIIKGLTDEQHIRILRYLSGHPRDGLSYCDYLRICDSLEELIFGLTPSIPIAEACDKALKKVKDLNNIELGTRFRTRTQSADYLKLTTYMTEEDKEIFKYDNFIVIAPYQPRDLFKEGRNMHNCVSTYTGSVAKGDSNIYFLRRKTEPEKSYGTLEVKTDMEGNRHLSQAKAFANGRLPEPAQKYLAKWCRFKKILPDALNLRLAA